MSGPSFSPPCGTMSLAGLDTDPIQIDFITWKCEVWKEVWDREMSCLRWLDAHLTLVGHS